MPSVTYSSSKPSAPESITILTSGNYTVPAGKSAKISAICNGGSTVSLNGSVVLTGSTWETIRANASPMAINISGTGIISRVMGNPLTTGTSNAWSIPSNGGMTSINGTTITASNAGAVYTNSTAQTAVTAQYSVPAGTIVATSGGSCVIEIYSA